MFKSASLALFAAGASATLLGSDINFNGTHAYTVPAHTVAIDDFNGDGNPDVIAGASALYFLAGRGNGRFLPPTKIAAAQPGGALATALFTGDFNGDGNADVVAIYYTNPATIVVLLGEGNGAFQAPATYTGAGFPTQAVAADLDGDGITDLAFSTYGGSYNGVAFFKGNANGTFQAAEQIVSSGGAAVSLAAGDFNGDSAIDLVVGWEASSGNASEIDLLLNNGGGVFQAFDTVPITTTTLPTAGFAVGDFNGDRNLDLVINLSYSGGPLFLPGAGNGTFNLAGVRKPNAAAGKLVNSSAQSIAAPSGSFVAADINQDGKLDLVSDGYYMEGNGTGVFSEARIFSFGFGNTGLPTAAAAVADLNHDSKLDVVSGIDPSTAIVGEPAAYMQVSLGNGDGTFDTSRYVEGANPLCCGPAVPADVNNDKKVDLILTGPAVALGNGDGTFYSTGASLPSFGPFPAMVAVGDFNKDGNMDIVSLVQGGGVGFGIYLGDGKGDFEAAYHPLPFSAQTVTIGDLNNDGIPDLVLCGNDDSGNGPPSLAFLFGKGDGTFMGPVYSQSALKPVWVVMTDLNGDHRTDLAILNQAETLNSTPPYISLFLSQSDGTFQEKTIPLAVGLAPSTLIAQDLNGDGFVDLAVSFGGTTYAGVVTFLGAAGETWNYSGFYSSLLQPGTGYDNLLAPLLTFADIDGDGILDMITVQAPNVVEVWRGNGNGAFVGSSELFGPPNLLATLSLIYAPASVAAADFNGDSKMDLTVNGPVLLNLTQ